MVAIGYYFGRKGDGVVNDQLMGEILICDGRYF